jgi:lysophospholipase L1-like esterase
MTRVCVLALLVCGPVASQTPNPLMKPAEALKMFHRAVELVESTAFPVPGLSRASAPMLENTRQTLKMIERSPGQSHAGLVYSFLIELRAYLALADAAPKPPSLPDASRRQFEELRAIVDRTDAHLRALLDAREAQLRSPDRDNLRRYAEANSLLPPPKPGSPRVVFLGDSITDFWRLNEYFPERDFVNRGISGQITGEMLGRMMADVVNLKPAAVLILAGTNDLARGVALETIQNNYTMMADVADAHKIKVLFASVLPISDYHKDKNPLYERSPQRPMLSIRALNNWLQEFCRARGYVYVDYFSAMVDSAGYLRADLADDGLHPNSAGYRVMAPIALAAIDKLLRAAQPQPAPARKRRLF